MNNLRKMRCLTCYATLTVCIIIIIYTYTSSQQINFKPAHHVSLNERTFDTMRQLAKSVKDVQINKYNTEFISIVNIIQADTDVTPDVSEPSITWCSHCSENHLHHIPRLAATWDGHVSITVFTHGSKILHTLQYLSALHHCDANVKHRVNFHLCIPIRDVGQFTVTHTDDELQMINISCNILLENVDVSLVNFANKRGTYPINMLRNLAMKNAYTQYVLTVDIDFIPSENVTSKLQLFFKTNTIRPKTAFILPPFETNVLMNTTISRNTLIKMWKRGTARPFQHKLCSHCHANTDYNRWKSLHVGKNLSVAYYPDWKECWEPYLITKKDEVPDFNEKFNGYGYDRMSQMSEIYVSGFRFAVLDDGFLMHDGFKERKYLTNGTDKEIKHFEQIYNLFKIKLRKQYGTRGRTLPISEPLS